MGPRIEQRYGANRRKTRVAATLVADGFDIPAVIVDCSARGVKLKLACPVAPGTAVRLAFLEAEENAIVHWWRAGHAGLRFLDRLDRDTLFTLETAADELAEWR